MVPIVCQSNNNNNNNKLRMPADMTEFSDYDKFFSFNEAQELSSQSEVYHNTSEEMFETSEGESDKCDTEDGDERGSIQRGDIEIDISSIESNSEVSTPLINNPLFISN